MESKVHLVHCCRYVKHIQVHYATCPRHWTGSQDIWILGSATGFLVNSLISVFQMGKWGREVNITPPFFRPSSLLCIYILSSQAMVKDWLLLCVCRAPNPRGPDLGCSLSLSLLPQSKFENPPVWFHTHTPFIPTQHLKKKSAVKL